MFDEDDHHHHPDSEVFRHLEIYAGHTIPLRQEIRDRIAAAAVSFNYKEVEQLVSREWRIQHAYVAGLLGLPSDEPEANVLEVLTMKRAQALGISLDAKLSEVMDEELRTGRSLTMSELRRGRKIQEGHPRFNREDIF